MLSRCEYRLKRLRPYLEHGFLEIDNNPAERTMRPIAPNIRVVHLLHPEDLILYNALVIIVKDDIEAARVSRRAKKVFSYRVDLARPDRLYKSHGSYDAYLAELAKKAAKSSTSFVVIADIADFYPRICQHRFENIVQSVATKQRRIDVA